MYYVSTAFECVYFMAFTSFEGIHNHKWVVTIIFQIIYNMMRFFHTIIARSFHIYWYILKKLWDPTQWRSFQPVRWEVEKKPSQTVLCHFIFLWWAEYLERSIEEHFVVAWNMHEYIISEVQKTIDTVRVVLGVWVEEFMHSRYSGSTIVDLKHILSQAQGESRF